CCNSAAATAASAGSAAVQDS
ncbi:hypothetical protein A2U01_0093982, partial [Trifolium medium]|nr:hypothetical protein [Trifolium medium]